MSPLRFRAEQFAVAVCTSFLGLLTAVKLLARAVVATGVRR